MKINCSDYDYEPIGFRIKQARQNKKYTQDFISEKLNVTSQHISEIERGLSGISVPTLMSLCKLLDVDADYILFGTITRSNSSPINKIIENMSPQQRLCAEDILKAYAKSCGII